VGDDAQAIYSFRAAAVENILGFPERFQPPANVVTLAQNYRSTQQVLDVANALLTEAPRQHRKYLLSIRGAGARPRLVTVEELQTQAEYVVAEVLRRREANVPLKRQAVLFRSASHSDLLEVELAKRNVPFVKYGGLRFLEAAHVKDLMAVLRWADNPRNTLAAFRTLQLLPGVGPVNARLAIEHLETAGHTFEALEGFRPPETGAGDWARLIELMRSLAVPERPWAGQVQLVREWYRPHFERIYEQRHTRLGDLEQLELLQIPEAGVTLLVNPLEVRPVPLAHELHLPRPGPLGDGERAHELDQPRPVARSRLRWPETLERLEGVAGRLEMLDREAGIDRTYARQQLQGAKRGERVAGVVRPPQHRHKALHVRRL